jgi:hypothetical protein
VQLTGTSDDVLTSNISNPSLDKEVRLQQTLETFNKLGQICSVVEQ